MQALAAGHASGVAADLEFLAGEFVARALDVSLRAPRPGHGRPAVAPVRRAGRSDAARRDGLAGRLAGRRRPAVAAGPACTRSTGLAPRLAAALGNGAPARDDAQRDCGARSPGATTVHAASTTISRASAATKARSRRACRNAVGFRHPQHLADLLACWTARRARGRAPFLPAHAARSYWGDLQTLRERRRRWRHAHCSRRRAGEPTLQAWGAAGRDFMALLGYEVVRPHARSTSTPIPPVHAGPRHVLALQSDLFTVAALPPPRARSDCAMPAWPTPVPACASCGRARGQLRALLDDRIRRCSRARSRC